MYSKNAFFIFFSGYKYKKNGKKYWRKYPKRPDAKHSTYGTIRKKWEHKKWVASLNGAKTYMTYSNLGLSGQYLRAVRCVPAPP